MQSVQTQSLKVENTIVNWINGNIKIGRRMCWQMGYIAKIIKWFKTSIIIICNKEECINPQSSDRNVRLIR